MMGIHKHKFVTMANDVESVAFVTRITTNGVVCHKEGCLSVTTL